MKDTTLCYKEIAVLLRFTICLASTMRQILCIHDFNEPSYSLVTDKNPFGGRKMGVWIISLTDVSFLWPPGVTQNLSTWLRIPRSNFLWFPCQVALPERRPLWYLEMRVARVMDGMGKWISGIRKLRVAASNGLRTLNQILFPFWGSISLSITWEGWTWFMV